MMSSVTSFVRLPSPSALLGIDGFKQWYPGQEDVFHSIVGWYHGDKRFLGLSVAAGSGKSLNAILAAKLLGVRTCILTVTKGLQEQYMRDVEQVDGVNVKGRNNFVCRLVPTLFCDEGPCHEGLFCNYHQAGCYYYDQLNCALESRLVVTNYAYYLAQTQFSTGLGDFGLLVCDEASLAFGALENHLSIYLYRSDVESIGVVMPRQTRDWIVWQQWARENKSTVQGHANKLEREVKDLRSANKPVASSLSRIARSARSIALKLSSMESAVGRWVVESRPHGWSFTPIWVSYYGNLLYRNTSKVMLMSALLSRKTMDVLGVPDGYSWYSAGSNFPFANTPIYHVATSRINHHTNDPDLTLWLSRIDQVIQRRLDRKGIVFTVSYDRANLILRNSRYADIMMSHTTRDVVDVVKKFKESSPPKVLVSPSVTSGWDFPGDGKPQYIIVAKIPYPNTIDAVMAARRGDDNSWPSFVAMETLVNESARSTRGASDKCEVFILDDSWRWFYPRYREFAPAWFTDRIRGSLDTVPGPLV